MTTATEEADRRWPDPEERAQRERFWKLKRGFRLGAAWAFRQPTDDARIEAARLAGAHEALEAVKGYLSLVTKDLEGTLEWKRGVWALSGRLQHMIVEAQGQVEGDREVQLLRYANPDETPR